MRNNVTKPPFFDSKLMTRGHIMNINRFEHAVKKENRKIVYLQTTSKVFHDALGDNIFNL